VSVQRPIRVVLAMSTTEGDDPRGADVALRLRRAGMEVIDTGAHDGPEDIAGAAVREDADVVALSLCPEQRPELVPRLIELLQARGARNVVVLVNGDRQDGEPPTGGRRDEARAGDVVRLLRATPPSGP
jgi:methylmalonyl-CoA mutase, C-terminal domain